LEIVRKRFFLNHKRNTDLKKDGAVHGTQALEIVNVVVVQCQIDITSNGGGVTIPLSLLITQ
jgi:hypothetical protein